MGWKEKIGVAAAPLVGGLSMLNQKMLESPAGQAITNFLAEHEAKNQEDLDAIAKMASSRLGIKVSGEDIAQLQNLVLGSINVEGTPTFPNAIGKRSNILTREVTAPISDVGAKLTKRGQEMFMEVQQAKKLAPQIEAKLASGEMTPEQANAILQRSMGKYPEGAYRVKDLAEHPELFAAYPEKVANAKVTFDYIPPNAKGEVTKGGYSPTDGTYHINLAFMSSPQDMLGNLFHEGVHVGQGVGGLTKGISPVTIKNGATRLYNYIRGNPSIPMGAKQDLLDELTDIIKVPKQEYDRSFGENLAAEARNQMRSPLEDLLRKQPFESTGRDPRTMVNTDLWHEKNPQKLLEMYQARKADPALVGYKDYLREQRGMAAGSEVQDPKSIIEGLGLPYRGIYGELKDKGKLHMFDDPVSGSTYSLPESEFTRENVLKRIREERPKWKPEQMDWSKDPLGDIADELISGGKPTPAESIDRFYQEGGNRAQKDLKIAGKHGENPYDWNKQGADALLMDAQAEGKEGFIPYIKRHAENLGEPMDVTAAKIAQSGARRNYQMHPTVEKALDDFLNEHLDMTPKVKKELPFQTKPVTVEKPMNPDTGADIPTKQEAWYDELNRPIFAEAEKTPDVNQWAETAKTDSEIADDLFKSMREQERRRTRYGY